MDKLKILFFIIFITAKLCIPSGFAETSKINSEEYRYNPFQFHLPEYSMKSETINLEKNFKHNHPSTIIDLFGIKVNFTQKNLKIKKINPTTILVKLDDKKAVLVNYEKEILMGCMDEKEKKQNKDFCSSFSSTKDFYYKAFRLTKEDLLKEEYRCKGFSWIVHKKGIIFKRVSDIKIYEKQNMTIFRTDLNDKKMSAATELFIFKNDIKPDHVIFTFNFKDKEFIDNTTNSLH